MMLNPYYDKSADGYLNLGGTAVIFALSILIYTWGFFIPININMELKIHKTCPFIFKIQERLGN